MKKGICGIILIIMLVGCQSDSSPTQGTRIQFWAGRGLPALFVENLTRHMTDIRLQDMELLTYTVGDCCAVVSQWALTSREMDMAMMCPDAATRLVASNDAYLLAGTILVAGDVLIRKGQHVSPLQRIGISHQRQSQRTLVREVLKESEVEIVEMLPNALLYALERDAVDAVVVDIFLATQSPLQLAVVGYAHTPIPTQSLVVRRESIKDLGDKGMYVALQKAIDDTNLRIQQLSQVLPSDPEKEVSWINSLTKFVLPHALP